MRIPISTTFEENVRAELIKTYRAVLKAEHKTDQQYSRSEYIEDIMLGKRPLLKVPEAKNNDQNR